MARSHETPAKVEVPAESQPTAAATTKTARTRGAGVSASWEAGPRSLEGGNPLARCRCQRMYPIRCGSASGAQCARHARAPRRRSVGERRAGRTAPMMRGDTAAERVSHAERMLSARLSSAVFTALPALSRANSHRNWPRALPGARPRLRYVDRTREERGTNSCAALRAREVYSILGTQQ